MDALTIITGVTLVVLIWYTIETYKLRVAAQNQTTEITKPVVALRTITESSDETDRTRALKVRNVGPGPAFNVTIKLLLRRPTTVCSFVTDDLLAAGEEQYVIPMLTNEQTTERSAGWDVLERAVRAGTIELPEKVCITYSSANGFYYQTVQTLMTDGTTGQLVIPFNESKRL
jgi:hypothetical protein